MGLSYVTLVHIAVDLSVQLRVLILGYLSGFSLFVVWYFVVSLVPKKFDLLHQTIFPRERVRSGNKTSFLENIVNIAITLKNANLLVITFFEIH